jgi:radical SAM-linked protein
MVRHKVRIRFRKAGALRLISHHDLMRCFERMLRRAALPFHSTQGFNPRPRLVFALSLPLGIVGREEVVELELTEPIPPSEVRERLTRQAPAGLDILDIKPIAPKTVGQVQRVCYRLPLPAERRAGLPERAAALLAAPECWVLRTRPEPRRLDVRPYLNAIRILSDALELDLRVTPTGTTRPDEVLALLGVDDLLAAGSVLERSRLELHDESEHAEPPATDTAVRPPAPGDDLSMSGAAAPGVNATQPEGSA